VKKQIGDPAGIDGGIKSAIPKVGKDAKDIFQDGGPKDLPLEDAIGDAKKTEPAGADKSMVGGASATAEFKDEGTVMGDPKPDDKGVMEDPALGDKAGSGGSSGDKALGGGASATAEFKDEGTVMGAPKLNKEGGVDDPAFMGSDYDPESGVGGPSSSSDDKPQGGGPSARAEFKDEGFQEGAPKKDGEGNAEYPAGVTGGDEAPTARSSDGSDSTLEKGAPKKDDTSGASSSSQSTSDKDKSDKSSDSTTDDKNDKAEKTDTGDKDDKKKGTSPIDPGDPAEGSEGGEEAVERFLPGGGGQSEEEERSEERNSVFGRQQTGNPAESSGRGGTTFRDPKSMTGQPSLAGGGTLGERREESLTNIESVVNPDDR
jgi:hypothetical protein